MRCFNTQRSIMQYRRLSVAAGSQVLLNLYQIQPNVFIHNNIAWFSFQYSLQRSILYLLYLLKLFSVIENCPSLAEHEDAKAHQKRMDLLQSTLNRLFLFLMMWLRKTLSRSKMLCVGSHKTLAPISLPVSANHRDHRPKSDHLCPGLLPKAK
jgi:hypothetical protein